MSCRRVSGASVEQGQAVVESLEKVTRFQDGRPGGGQLDGQGQAVEAFADLHHGVAAVSPGSASSRAQREGRVHRACPLQEQGLRCRGSVGGAAGGGGGAQWAEPVPVFADEAESLAARGQDLQTVGGAGQPGQSGGAGKELLEVVEDQQHVAAGQRPGELVGGILTGREGQAQGGRDRRHEAFGVGDGGEGDVPDLTVPRRAARQFERQPGLADAAGAGERDDPGVGFLESSRSSSSRSRPRRVFAGVGTGPSWWPLPRWGMKEGLGGAGPVGFSQGRPGVDAQLVVETVAGGLEDRQRVRLPVACGEGAHSFQGRGLVQWVLGGQRLEPGERLGGVTEVDVGSGGGQLGLEGLVFEAVPGGLGQGDVG